jgi:hypothetical protein
MADDLEDEIINNDNKLSKKEKRRLKEKERLDAKLKNV